MAQYEKLDIALRDEQGTGAVKRIRRSGMIPAVYYYHGEKNINLVLDQKKFYKALHSGHHIFEVQLSGEQQYVMIKEIQYHPVTDNIIHVDLMRVRRDQKIVISVPIHLKGESIGVKEGGVLTQNLNILEISCLPGDVPEEIILDINDVGMHEVLAVSDIEVADNIDIVSAEDLNVLTVQPPKVIEVEVPVEEVEELEELEEGETAPETAPEGEEPSAETESKEKPAEE
jgi:large subunit ribosomal protein L25